MHGVSSHFSLSDDNLGFYFCFRLPVVKVVLFHEECWNAFAQKEQKWHHYLDWINVCKNPNILSIFTHKTGQRKRLIFARGRGWKTLGWGKGSFIRILEHKKDLYTVYWPYKGNLQLSQRPKSFPCLEVVWLALSVVFNVVLFNCPFHIYGSSPRVYVNTFSKEKLSSSINHQKKLKEMPKLSGRELDLPPKRASSETLYIITSSAHFMGIIKSSDSLNTTGTADRNTWPVLHTTLQSSLVVQSCLPQLPELRFCLQVLHTKLKSKA